MPEDTIVETPPAAEVEARKMGWRPREEFDGDDKHWVDAETFITRGKQMAPLLRKHNEKLEGEVSRLNGQVSTLSAALKEAKDAMEAFKAYQGEETKRQVEKAKADLRVQLKAARKEGDIDAEVEIREQMDKLDESAAKAAPAPAPAPTTAKVSPAFQEFLDTNEWFNKDMIRTAIAVEVGRALRREHPAMAEKELYEKAAEQSALYVERAEKRRSKVESGGAGAGGGSSGSYSDLPADVKAKCDQQARMVVGPNKMFKDLAAWRTHYSKMYFAS